MELKTQASNSDQDATGSSTYGEACSTEEKSESICKEIVDQGCSTENKDEIEHHHGKSEQGCSKLDQEKGKKFVGVKMFKSGKYGAQIGIKKKRVWLGIFDTAEEAHNMYLAKRREIEGLKISNERKKNSDKESAQRKAHCRRFDQKSANNFMGVKKLKSGKYSARISIKNKKVWLGTFNTAEEAYNVYLAKRCEMERMKIAKPSTKKSDKESGQTSDLWHETAQKSEDGKSVQQETLDLPDETVKQGTESGKSENGESIQESPCPDLQKSKRSCKNFMGRDLKMQSEEISSSFKQHHGKVGFKRFDKNKGNNFIGVRMSKSGKYNARIGVKKKEVWLGTYDTAEEAYNVYLAKRREIDEKMKAKQGRKKSDKESSETSYFSNKTSIEESPCSILEKFKGVKKFIGAYKKKSGRYRSYIKDPFTKKRLYLGTFNTAEEASNVFLAKKLEFEAKRRAKRCLDMVPGKQEKCDQLENFDLSLETEKQGIGNIDCERPENGNIEQNLIESDSLVNFGFMFGVRVIDENGFLMDGFSKIDDLSLTIDDDN